MRKIGQTSSFVKETLSIAFIKLLRMKEYNDISITEICELSGYGRTTYYRHFTSNKEELILYIAHVRWQEAKHNHPELLKDENKLLLMHFYNNKDFFLLLTKRNLEHLIFKMIYDELKDDKEPDSNLDGRYNKAFFVGGLYGILVEWIKDDFKDTPQELSTKFMNVMFNGFANKNMK